MRKLIASLVIIGVKALERRGDYPMVPGMFGIYC